jgi:hypothetical protein
MSLDVHVINGWLQQGSTLQFCLKPVWSSLPPDAVFSAARSTGATQCEDHGTTTIGGFYIRVTYTHIIQVFGFLSLHSVDLPDDRRTWTHMGKLATYFKNILIDQVSVIIWPTVSRPVCHHIGPQSGILDQLFFLSKEIIFRHLRLNFSMEALSLMRGRVCNLLIQLPLDLSGIITLCFKSRRIWDHILPSHLRLELPFCRPLHLPDLRWNYSKPLPHAVVIIVEFAWSKMWRLKEFLNTISRCRADIWNLALRNFKSKFYWIGGAFRIISLLSLLSFTTVAIKFLRHEANNFVIV